MFSESGPLQLSKVVDMVLVGGGGMPGMQMSYCKLSHASPGQAVRCKVTAPAGAEIILNVGSRQEATTLMVNGETVCADAPGRDGPEVYETRTNCRSRPTPYAGGRSIGLLYNQRHGFGSPKCPGGAVIL